MSDQPLSDEPQADGTGGPERTANSEHTVATVLVQASVEACYAVGIDIAAYPEWVENLRSADIQSTDAEGRPEVVKFEAEGIGRKTSYVLAYDLEGAPYRMAWSLVSGDLTREIEGRYVFHDMTEDPAMPVTEVDYELTIDLAVPLPGFVKRRAEDKIVTAALSRFKQRVEALAAEG